MKTFIIITFDFAISTLYEHETNAYISLSADNNLVQFDMWWKETMLKSVDI